MTHHSVAVTVCASGATTPMRSRRDATTRPSSPPPLRRAAGQKTAANTPSAQLSPPPDANDDPITYTLGGTDETSFSILHHRAAVDQGRARPRGDAELHRDGTATDSLIGTGVAATFTASDPEGTASHGACCGPTRRLHLQRGPT